jgi:hypothetical protein
MWFYLYLSIPLPFLTVLVVFSEGRNLFLSITWSVHIYSRTFFMKTYNKEQSLSITLSVHIIYTLYEGRQSQHLYYAGWQWAVAVSLCRLPEVMTQQPIRSPALPSPSPSDDKSSELLWITIARFKIWNWSFFLKTIFSLFLIAILRSLEQYWIAYVCLILNSYDSLSLDR